MQLEVFSSRQFPDWLAQQNISLALTTYQTGQLIFLGVNPAGQLSGYQRLYDRAMGLYATTERLYVSCKYQVWQLDNALTPGELYQGYDKLYIPRIGHTTGDLDIHDLALDRDRKIVFVSSLLNCLATFSDRKSCKPLWKPAFISRVVNEDRCHLNGMAMVEGQPGYVTACSRSDLVDGWRDRRIGGGVVIDVASNEIVCTNLSMPHSPRWYRDKLWVLNSGRGELGYVDLQTGKFEAVVFCPGYLRGLAFWGNYAIVGLSKPRHADKTFSGLPLDELLQEKDADARCGLMVVDLNTGAIANWVRFEGKITELYDVQILPHVKRPMALGFQTEEIAQLISLELENEFIQIQPQSSSEKTLTFPYPKQKERRRQEQLIATKKEQNIWLASYPRSGNTLLRTILWHCFGLPSASVYPQDFGDNQELAQEVGHIEHNADGKIHFPPDSLELIKTHEYPTDNQPAIYVVRDGRAACVSLYKFYNQEQSLESIIKGQHRFGSWAEHLKAWQPWQRPNTLLLKYEDITSNFEKILEQLSQFLHRDIIAKELPNRDRLAKIDGRWINLETDWRDSISERDMLLFQEVNSDMMAMLDYSQPDLSKIIPKKQQPRQLTISPRPDREPLTANQAKILFERSRTLKKEGNLEQAEVCLREVIQVQPNHWGAHNNLGTLMQNKGNILEAKHCYQKAIEFNGNFAHAIANLASISQLEEDWEQAKKGFYQALKLKPDYVPAHINLANLFKQQQRMGAAIEHFEKVIALEPNHTEAYFNLGQIFEYQGKSEAALRCYQQAQTIDPEATHLACYINLVKLRLCYWENYETKLAELTEVVENYQPETSRYGFNPFVLSTFPFSLRQHQIAAQNQAKTITQNIVKLKEHLQFKHHKTQPQKLRIGFISPDFREHAVGRLIYQIFPYFDRDHFEIYCYNTVDVDDHITQQVRSGCDVFVELASLSTEAAARRIYEDGIHIMIDLAGYTIGNRAAILALQPAPIQAQWLGYPDTMGADFIQYYLGDHTLITEEIAQHYTEEIIYLPHAFVASPLKISDKVMTRTEFGLPDDAFVFCCFNSHYKITPDLFDLWLRILEQVPNSVLWLAAGTGRANLRAEAKKRGLEENRLIFAEKIPHEEYLARYALADLYLDTFIYNAGSTAAAVLWSGLPMLTCPGYTNASRMGASLLTAGGLESGICASTAEYEQKAVYLANHPQELAQLRRQLQEQFESKATYPPLFKIESFVRSLELAFHQIWIK